MSDRAQTVFPYFAKMLDKYRDEERICFLDDKLSVVQSLSYNGLFSKAIELARFIRSKVETGERVLLLFHPGLDFVISFFACLYAGVTAVPLYPPTDKKLLDKFLQVMANAKPALILSTPAFAEEFRDLATVASLREDERLQNMALTLAEISKTKAVALAQGGCWCLVEPMHLAGIDQYDWVLPPGEALAFLQYTSGSTGTPKGVMISHRNLLENVLQIDAVYTAGDDATAVIWLPPYHDMGLIGGIMTTILTGTRLYLMAPMSFLRKPLTWLEAISRYKATVTCAPNFAYDLCVRKISDEDARELTLASLRYVLNGAEPVSLDVMHRFSKKFAHTGFRQEMFCPCYGMAEATLMVTGQRGIDAVLVKSQQLQQHKICLVEKGDEDTRTFVSAGPIDACIKIINPETLIPCSEHEIGEIWTSSASVAQGYWGNAELTAESFQALTPLDPCVGYLRTGDLGFTHAGKVFITGRRKDLLIINGTNHYPQDIEASIEKAHPAIKSGYVAAFPLEQQGKEVLGLAIGVAGTSDYQGVLEAVKCVLFQNHQLALHRLVLLAPKNILKTTSGKIRRQPIKNALLQNALTLLYDYTGAEEPHPTESIKSAPKAASVEGTGPIEVIIQAALADILDLPAEGIDKTTHFAQYGLDSLMAMELANRVQKNLGLDWVLDMGDIINHASVAELALHIHDKWATKTNVDDSILESRVFVWHTHERHQQQKPRHIGLTSILDTGIPSGMWESILASSGNYIDIIKLGFGTCSLYPIRELSQKIALFKSANIRVCPGGTFMEIAHARGQFSSYLQDCKRLGFDTIEISDGNSDISLKKRLDLLEQAKNAGFHVLVEIGGKGVDGSRYKLSSHIEEAKAFLDYGVENIIVEARESGTLGIFNQDTSINATEFEALCEAISPEKLIFEAPLKHQQLWLIKRLGLRASLGNISPWDILALEALRQGLRADVMDNL